MEKRVSQEALDFVDEYDKLHGKEWSNAKEGVAAFAEAFADEQLAEVHSIITAGTVNRRHYKLWELTLLKFCTKFGG